MSRVHYVLATDWNVSTVTGTHITGCLLTISKLVPNDRPSEKEPFTTRVVRLIDEMPFDSAEQANEYAFALGYLKIWTPYVWNKVALDRAAGRSAD